MRASAPCGSRHHSPKAPARAAATASPKRSRIAASNAGSLRNQTSRSTSGGVPNQNVRISRASGSVGIALSYGHVAHLLSRHFSSLALSSAAVGERRGLALVAAAVLL